MTSVFAAGTVHMVFPGNWITENANWLEQQLSSFNNSEEPDQSSLHYLEQLSAFSLHCA